jgi:hypothetical protein
VAEEDEELTGCDADFLEEERTADEDVDAVVLFADVDPDDEEAVSKRKEEWSQVFSAGGGG